jgi:hypothetical protein
MPSSKHIHDNNSVMAPDLGRASLHKAPVAVLYEQSDSALRGAEGVIQRSWPRDTGSKKGRPVSVIEENFQKFQAYASPI